MLSFAQPVDIANRGADHCGAARIDRTFGFSEQSRTSLVLGPLYHPLRRAALQENAWRFAIREAILRPIDPTTMLLTPALWVGSTTYFFGSIVVDQDGTPWMSNIPNNLNNQPEVSEAWTEYFGPMTVSLWDTTGKTAYSAGELVYTAAGDGTNRVYLSRISANSDNPATATTWSATTTYFKNQIVTASAVAYMSLIDLNLNQNPVTTFVAPWSSATTYSAAQKATGSDGVIYQSIAGGNLNHDPTLSPAFWTNTVVLSPWATAFVAGTGSVNWLQIGGIEFPMGVTLTPIFLIYPIGAGPTTQTSSRNVFRLPAGFLRTAPQEPKAGAISYLGVPGNRMQDDWLFEGRFLVSSTSSPIRLRFVADTVNVAAFDALFCEGLGAQMGMEGCEPLTQSSAKLKDIEGKYKVFMWKAKISDAIIRGSEDDPLDDYLAARA